MRVLAAFVFVAAVTGAIPAAANTFEGCTAEQSRMVRTAFDSAKTLTLKAAASVGDTREYARWFGEYSFMNAERVRASLKSVVTTIRSGAVTARCERIGPDACQANEYAYVFSDEPYLMYLCPSFFDLPSLAALQPGARRSNFGTREGTIVHEVSHFLQVAGTEDHCYSRLDCSTMARSDPRRAIENADSYQYFTEDVTYYARQPIEGKPDNLQMAQP